MFLQNSFSELAELEWVEPRAFEPDDQTSRELCGFILALALVHSDIKNIFLIQSTLKEAEPSGESTVRGTFTPTKERGEFYGLLNFTNRQHISILRELFELIRRNRTILDGATFQRVLKQTPKGSRESWESLVEAAIHGSGDFHKAIQLIRHKVGSHYDPGQVLVGYEYFFKKRRVMEKAFLSRGRRLSESRFYFADAAAESYVCFSIGSDDPGDLFRAIQEHTRKLVLALGAIVTTFLTIKVGGFRRMAG